MDRSTPVDKYAIYVKPLSEELGGGFEASFPQLARGVVGYGSTQQEAIEELLAAVPDFLEAAEEMGQPLPAPELPREWDEFSGKFNVRVPKMLHAKLVRLADAQDVSLNALVQAILMSGATALEAGHEFGATGSSNGTPGRSSANTRLGDDPGLQPVLEAVHGARKRFRNTAGTSGA